MKDFESIITIDTLTRKSIGELIRTFRAHRESAKSVFIQWQEYEWLQGEDEEIDPGPPDLASGIVRIRSRSKPVVDRIAKEIETTYVKLRLRENSNKN